MILYMSMLKQLMKLGIMVTGRQRLNAVSILIRKLVGTILKSLGKSKDVRILVCPDHPTPVARRVHDRAPVPFVMWGEGIKPKKLKNYSEKEATKAGLRFKSGQELIRFFLKNPPVVNH